MTDCIHVIATTRRGTAAALKVAAERAAIRSAGIVLLIVQRVSFTWRRANPEPPAIEAYRTLSESAGVELRVRLCLCHRRGNPLDWILGSCADVVIGGKKRHWWLSAEERLARELVAAGHHVTFARAL